MATYLQGVTDYIPDYQPFQPDYNFYANALQTKQNQYDSNYKQINNVYADIINAPLTHNLNKEKKDLLLNQIDTNLNKISNLDLSLQQNVNQATQVFRPFYEDKYLMKDMAFTKNAQGVLQRAQSLQNSMDEKQSATYWPAGIKAINYQIQDFAEASIEKTLNFANVKYTPWLNASQHYMEMAKKLGVKASTKYNVNSRGQKDPYGNITITQQNGTLIIPTLQEMFAGEYANNPQLQEINKTLAYVERHDWAEQHASEFGGNKLAAEKDYLQKKFDYISSYIDKKNQQASQNLQITENKSNDVENQIKEGNVNPKQISYQEALASGATVQEAILMSTRKLNDQINNANRTSTAVANKGGLNLENLQLARMKVDAGVASLLAEDNIRKTAKRYANIDATYEESLSALGLEEAKSKIRKQEALYKAQLDATNSRQSAYEKWAVTNNKLVWKQIDPNDPTRGGQLVANDTYDKTFRKSSSDPGSTTEESVNLIELNKELAESAESEYTSSFLDNAMMSIYNLVSGNNPQISKEELNKMLNQSKTSGGTLARRLTGKDANSPGMQKKLALAKSDPVGYYKSLGKYSNVYKDNTGSIIGVDGNGQLKYLNPKPDPMGLDPSDLSMLKKMYNIGEDDLIDDPLKYTDNANDDAYNKFMKIYNAWTKDKSVGRSMLKNTFVYKGFNEWLTKNGGSQTAQEWTQNPTLTNAVYDYETYTQFEDANEQIYEMNSEKVLNSLKTALAVNFKGSLDQKDINDIAEYYKTQYFDGAAGSYRKLGKNEFVRGRDNVDEVLNIGGKLYAGTEVDDFLRKNILPDLIEKSVSSGKVPVGKIKKGTDWNETSSLSPEQWRELNSYIDSDSKMQELESSYNLTSDSSLIESADYWDIPRASGFSEVSDYRDKLAKDWKRNNNASLAVEIDSVESFIEKIESVLDVAYDKVAFDPNSETGITPMINGIKADIGGRASLAADKEFRYVNLQDPMSQGFQQFGQIIQDINRINFNQSGNYRVSVKGLAKMSEDSETGMFKHDLTPETATRLVQSLYQNASKRQSMDPIMIENSRIAMEDRNTNAITIFPSRDFLEDNIKSVPYQNYDGETDDKASIIKAIDNIMENGITFIAPKNEWSNEFTTTNKETPLELALNVLGTIDYSHPNNSGSYTITKVDGVPGATHMGKWTITTLQPDGTIKKHEPRMLAAGINRGGSTIEDIQKMMYNTLQIADRTNQQLFKQFYEQGNTKAIQNAQEAFGYTSGKEGFTYKK